MPEKCKQTPLVILLSSSYETGSFLLLLSPSCVHSGDPPKLVSCKTFSCRSCMRIPCSAQPLTTFVLLLPPQSCLLSGLNSAILLQESQFHIDDHDHDHDPP
ncbi:hypothetical protein V8G54_000746 [Vigna mungo]|uniref:Uncharacterized protein n=1 Tax=Vigna mungo TaxID=3915 RepID=A0AAQ3S988_VIGMU